MNKQIVVHPKHVVRFHLYGIMKRTKNKKQISGGQRLRVTRGALLQHGTRERFEMIEVKY